MIEAKETEANSKEKPIKNASRPKKATKAKKRKTKKGVSKRASKASSSQTQKMRRSASFPACSLEEALTIANAIQKHASGQKVRRLTLFDQIGKSPDSGPSRQLITNSNKYGLTRGGYQAEYLELTPDGNTATSMDISARERVKARFKLAIEDIPPFASLYGALKSSRLPASSVLEDIAIESGIEKQDAKECVEIFIVNAKYIGLLKPIAGAERIIPIEQVLEEIPSDNAIIDELNESTRTQRKIDLPKSSNSDEEQDWEHTCFYISPIGHEGTEHRNHSDLFLGSIIEPALEEFNLKVIRADRIGRAGMITAQILNYILRSKLVIADLSYHNPNVFYELCLRHACRLPTVQIIRKLDKIPFDLDQFRTIWIDTESIFTLVPNLQSYKAEIATQVRMALSDPDSVDNPISTYYPNLKVQF